MAFKVLRGIYEKKSVAIQEAAGWKRVGATANIIQGKRGWEVWTKWKKNGKMKPDEVTIKYHGKLIRRVVHSVLDKHGDFDTSAPVYIIVPKIGGGTRRLYNGMKYRTGSAKDSPMKKLYIDTSAGN